MLELVFDVLDIFNLLGAGDVNRHPVPGTIGWGLIGVLLGALSTHLAGHHLIHAEPLRLANLVVLPLAAGAFTALLSRHRAATASVALFMLAFASARYGLC